MKLALCGVLAAALAAPAHAQSLMKVSADTGRPSAHPLAEAEEVVAFWRDAGHALWFAKDDDFDRLFRERYLAVHEAAARGELTHWRQSPTGTLALVILLDQFPRNAFRGSARMYATDEAARAIANEAIAAGHDLEVPKELRVFFILPFGHSENLADQERAVNLCRELGPRDLAQAEHHRDIIRRFGRFPHRNPILGRPMTPAEQQYLDAGGYAG